MDARELDELIRDARSEARAAVKARLRDRFERELLERAEQRLAPPRRSEPAPRRERAPGPETETEHGQGLWVYCVIGGDHPGVNEEVAGVAGGGAPRAVRAAGLGALVSEVPLDEFGEDGLKRNLNDLSWLEATVRAHEGVLDAVLAGGAPVPMRVCTIYRGEEHVREMLASHREELGEALERLAGRAEWGVKVLADRERHAPPGGRSDEQGPAPDGGDYLARKQRERREREAAGAELEEALREIHARLEEWATASELLPPQRRELAGYAGEMALNGAYLVDDERLEAFASVVEELRAQYAAAGLSFELTGPWPAYHFAGRLEGLGGRV